MDFMFTPDQERFRSEVRDLIRKELPLDVVAGAQRYRQANFEAAIAFRRQLGKRRWIGIGWPEEYGGLGASAMMQLIFHEEMIYHHAPLDPQAYQLGPALIRHGSDYLKRKFLEATAKQDIIWCQGFSEPDAGSDLAGLQTRAVADGDHYLITGQKIWTSMAHKADWMHMLARTDPDAPKHKGITYFVVDMRSAGITVQPLVDMTDESHFNQVFFDRVRVPKRNVIGDENMGWYVATTTLNNERSGIRDVTRVRRLFDDIVQAWRESSAARGMTLGPVRRHKLADVRVQLQVSRNLSYRVASMQDRGLQPNAEASVAKLFATELEQRLSRLGMEVLGPYACLSQGADRAPAHGILPYQYMLSITGTIAAGSSEINRNIIANRGLGLPRE